MKLPTMSSSTKILIGLLSGVLVGIFLGEYASVFKIVADGFVKLLQMTVLPYITLSIIASLGALSYDQVKTLGFRAGTVVPCGAERQRWIDIGKLLWIKWEPALCSLDQI